MRVREMHPTMGREVGIVNDPDSRINKSLRKWNC